MKLLKSTKGSMQMQALCLAVLLLLFTAVGAESMRLVLITTGVRSALESAASAAATDNWDEIYSGLREGHTGGYTAEGSIKYEEKELFVYLQEHLGVQKQGNIYRKTSGVDKLEYELSNFSSRVLTTPPAPSDSSAQFFSIITQATLSVPLDFGGFRDLPPLRVRLKVFAQYSPKFDAGH